MTSLANQHRRRLFYYRLGMLASSALIILAAVGEWLGWWRDLGLVVGAIGIVASFWLGIGTASEATLTALADPIERMADDMATIRVVLERIDERLSTR